MNTINIVRKYKVHLLTTQIVFVVVFWTLLLGFVRCDVWWYIDPVPETIFLKTLE